MWRCKMVGGSRGVGAGAGAGGMRNSALEGAGKDRLGGPRQL